MSRAKLLLTDLVAMVPSTFPIWLTIGVIPQTNENETLVMQRRTIVLAKFLRILL